MAAVVALVASLLALHTTTARLPAAGAASTVGGPITRAEVIARAKYWYDRGDTWYSQDQADAISDGTGGKYRPDCSGLVAMAWHLPKKSDGWDFNTDDFHAYDRKTWLPSLHDLLPGDALLKDGHMELFEKWINPADHTDGAWVYSENDYGQKTNHNINSWSEMTTYRGIRYHRIVGGSGGRNAPALAYDQGDGTMRVYRWQSTGTSFSRTSDYDSGPFSLSRVGNRVASGDVTGDGRDDIVMAHQYADGTFGFYVFPNGQISAGVWYTSGQFNLDRVNGRLVVGDFTGDGKAEPALAYDQGDGTMRIYRWQSTGSSFTRITDYDSGSFSLSRVGDRMASGDVDDDGRDDIVMAHQYADGTFGFYVFPNGQTSAGTWYTSGQFNLDRAAGRLVLGAW